MKTSVHDLIIQLAISITMKILPLYESGFRVTSYSKISGFEGIGQHRCYLFLLFKDHDIDT